MRKIKVVKAFVALLLPDEMIQFKSNRKTDWKVARKIIGKNNMGQPLYATRFCICTNWKYHDLYPEETKTFLDDFYARCPIGKDFSIITLTILHEVGHIKTWSNVNWWEDGLFRQLCDDQSEYIQLDAEYKATQWAINWLSDPSNQKIAHNFAHIFFSCKW